MLRMGADRFKNAQPVEPVVWDAHIGGEGSIWCYGDQVQVGMEGRRLAGEVLILGRVTEVAIESGVQGIGYLLRVTVFYRAGGS